MQIYGPFRVSTAQNTPGVQRNQTQQPTKAAEPNRLTQPADELDLSSASAGVNRMDEATAVTGGDIRIDRVAEIRRQIADGVYETAEKMDAALENILDQYA
ncbi:MAG: flagellar biosynthesis anti-sigma factor FlgM [Pirellulaceae bacterium]|nr:flagellar biosynthesis anti-sigma factor FlgM [Pirellulaceae bacterium]